jgi:hypothetical protein
MSQRNRELQQSGHLFRQSIDEAIAQWLRNENVILSNEAQSKLNKIIRIGTSQIAEQNRLGDVQYEKEALKHFGELLETISNTLRERGETIKVLQTSIKMAYDKKFCQIWPFCRAEDKIKRL